MSNNQKHQHRDSIDFGKENIPRLFVKLFVPTLLGLLFGALLNVADGIFVGRGVGSDALAAVNIAAPIFIIGTATALLFGSGVSVVAAVHLSHGKTKAANINVTQAFTISVALMGIVSLLIACFPSSVAHIFGGEGAISVMIVTGNYMFTPRLHEDGVAAYSVCCYLFPLVFMFGNAIAQSSLPIISYNHGQGNDARIKKALHLSLVMAFVLGLLMTLGGIFCATPMVSLFLQPGSSAWHICTEGLPLFSISYVFFTINVVVIGYLQSVERSRAATFFMLLRSCLLLIPAFVLLPHCIDNSGLWLAVPASELLTTVVAGMWMRLKAK